MKNLTSDFQFSFLCTYSNLGVTFTKLKCLLLIILEISTISSKIVTTHQWLLLCISGNGISTKSDDMNLHKNFVSRTIGLTISIENILTGGGAHNFYSSWTPPFHVCGCQSGLMCHVCACAYSKILCIRYN